MDQDDWLLEFRQEVLVYSLIDVYFRNSYKNKLIKICLEHSAEMFFFVFFFLYVSDLDPRWLGGFIQRKN